jgi:cytochrome c oxidase subunit 2
MLSKRILWTGLPIMVVFLLISTGCGTAQKKLSDTEIRALQPSGQIEDGVRVIKVGAKKYEFTPGMIVVKSGEKVRLEVTSTDVTHGFAVSEYKIDRRLNPNKTETILFTADKPGQFPVYCSVFCGIGHMSMEGTLVVISAEK